MHSPGPPLACKQCGTSHCPPYRRATSHSRPALLATQTAAFTSYASWIDRPVARSTANSTTLVLAMRLVGVPCSSTARGRHHTQDHVRTHRAPCSSSAHLRCRCMACAVRGHTAMSCAMPYCVTLQTVNQQHCHAAGHKRTRVGRMRGGGRHGRRAAMQGWHGTHRTTGHCSLPNDACRDLHCQLLY